MSEELSVKVARLETAVRKDQEHQQREITELKSSVHLLSREFHASQGELKSVGELYQLYRSLTNRIERDSEKRDAQHKELLNALSKKLDAGASAKWAVNFQKIMQWLIWFFMLMGAFGMGNWLQATLIQH
ncbi:hypothetical protein PVA44_07800 (plasmid) [Entomospira nematocerorum]|uniref:Uncharacterized protein n=1 Tax=Entomospira nematocerorum TaxID=2719987 RepID=A0A968GH79_9SPIO|nr:hypothetical protein [Entomospira nematocera]NIZ47816.1 hypothetical protein [Entomospira nematocera]WDI34749.1 hypothetical protein PVA44_07800 [Entomospira nematocera]